MRTRVLEIDPKAVKPGMIREIARIVAAEGVIVYPTDTFYGLGTECFSRPALQRIFVIKQRPGSKGLPVLVSDLDMAQSLAADLPAAFRALASRFWPGPLTIVLKAASHLPLELAGRGRTIGIRLPAVEWLRELIRAIGLPLVTTSANISGQKEIDSAEEAKTAFMGKVDLIVAGGKTPGGKPSTVVDFTGEKPVLIREGVLPKSALERFF
jgi:L-threonylcarbamoyladenylate synthase